MIAFIRGQVEAYGTDWIVVDQQGIGWQIAYPHCDDVHLHDEVMVYTYMHFTENETSLFGFANQEEKDLFMRLISVKGLGPKTAMNMLAKSGYNAIIQAIESGDVALLKKMPGIGAKSASQIVLDLKGKLVATDIKTKNQNTILYPQELNDALEGLKGLGYKSSELTHVADTLLKEPGLTAKEYLKKGLRLIAQGKMGE